MGVLMSKLFPSGPVLEVDHIQCCNRSDEDSSSSDEGVVYTGKMGQVIRHLLEAWPTSQHVDIHVRPTASDIIGTI